MKVRTILLLLFYVLFVLCLVPVLVVCFAVRARAPLIAAGKTAMGIGRTWLGIRVETTGFSNIPPGGRVVFMANHSSFLDGPLLFLVIPGLVRVILKKSIFRIPIVGLGMRYVGFVPVDRKGASGGRTSIERAARSMRERGYSFLIFPEGTRSLDGSLLPFRRGGFFLALAAGAPIVPASISGTFALMPKGRPFPRRGSVRVTFHPAVPVGGHSPEAMGPLIDEVRKRIAAGPD